MTGIDILHFLCVPCQYCGETSHMKEYHHSFHLEHKRYYLTCPKCQEQMILELEVSVKKKEDEAN